MNTTESIVYVVDDDPPVLKAVARLLRAAGFRVATFASPRRFLDQHDTDSPGCIVLDLAMPDLNGLELQAALEAAGEVLPIIFLTGHADIPASVKAMKLGAADFLTKPVDRDQLVQAIHQAIAMHQAARQTRQELDDIRRRLATLTPREHEVLEHVVSGRLNKQTAADLGAAEKTIKVHRARVMDKMQVDSLAELVRLAERVGIPHPAAEQPHATV